MIDDYGGKVGCWLQCADIHIVLDRFERFKSIDSDEAQAESFIVNINTIDTGVEFRGPMNLLATNREKRTKQFYCTNIELNSRPKTQMYFR